MKALISTTLLVLMLSEALAQEKLALYFPAGQSNAEILINEFLTPLGEDISVLPNNGWYTTAKTHKKWGFDLGVTVNSVFTSNEDKFYDVPSGLSGLSFIGTTEGNSLIPTTYGNESDFPVFNNSAQSFQFVGPDGFEPGKEYIFEAQNIYTLQGGLGLFKNTDLRFRFTPKINISGTEYGNWGVGLMHDLMQHITSAGESTFNLSVFLGYTVVNGTTDLSGIYSGSGQEAVVKASGFTGQVVGGVNLKIISFYGALGYDKGESDIDINGTYNVNFYTDEFGNENSLNAPFNLTDPYSYSYDNSGLRFTLGMRLKFGPVFLNGDYSFVGDSRVLALGLGFTVK